MAHPLPSGCFWKPVIEAVGLSAEALNVIHLAKDVVKRKRNFQDCWLI